MPTRNDAYILVATHIKSDNLRKHMLSVEAAMRAYAHKDTQLARLYPFATPTLAAISFIEVS